MSARRPPSTPSLRRASRGMVTVEFAMVVLPFLTVLLFIFELCFDLFAQEVLDAGLHVAAREVQTGNAQNVTNGTTFISNYLCPAIGSVLPCNNLYVSMTAATLTASQDFWNLTTGVLPVSGGVLNLSGFGPANFCNAGPGTPFLISAVYVAPTIVGWVLPNIISVGFGGTQVHAVMSQIGAVTESFGASGLGAGSAAQC